MKRSVIVVVSLIIGISFIGLLVLQAITVNSLVKMRKEQFDETVFRALDRTSRDMERNETFRYLVSIAENSGFDVNALQDQVEQERVKASLALGDSMKMFSVDTFAQSPLPQPLTLLPQESLDAASRRFREFMKNAFLYQKGVLEEVIYTILYNASDEDLRHRVDFEELNRNLKSELEAGGITLKYHFTVMDVRGREVYRSAHYDEVGSDYSYTQMLFRNDPSQKMGLMRVHFPEMEHYVLGAASTMVPMFIFTLVLFFTFCFTVWLIVRQKRDTEMKNDFINNMTHEFKTPISSISLAAQMLSDKGVKKTDALLEQLSGVIVSETKRLRFQVEKVLQMSLYERGNVRFNEKEIEANAIIDDVVNTFKLKVEKSGGVLNAQLNAEDDAVYVDEMHFTNVIYNLLDNAVKYRRVEVPLELTVTTENKNGHFVVTVTDNGIGIRNDDLKRIFDRFYRVHTGNQHDVKGFGLGLAYVKSMVQLMHGNIRAESEFGHGTSFIIALPVIDLG